MVFLVNRLPHFLSFPYEFSLLKSLNFWSFHLVECLFSKFEER